jgi:hypothetical protein
MKGFILTENEKKQIRSLYSNKGLIIEQNEKPKTTNDSGCVPVVVSGSFDVMVTDNPKNITNFINKLNAEIAKNENLKAAQEAGTLYVGKINLMGGASNRYGGKVVKPTMDNNYNPKSYTDDAKYTGDFDANLKLAEDRAKNVWTELQTLLPNNKITIGDGVVPTYESYVIDTNGATDKTNQPAIDSGKFNAGQIVKMTVDLCGSVVPSTDIKKCFESAIIEVSYDNTSEDQKHNCDNAVYQIFANGVPITSRTGNGWASLNNRTANNQYPADNSGGQNAVGKPYKYNYFDLTIDGVNKTFFNQENLYKYDGGLVISAKCMKTNYGSWQPEKGYDCHKWIGNIKLQTTSGVDVVNVGQSELPNTGLAFSTPNVFDQVANVAGFDACKALTQK